MAKEYWNSISGIHCRDPENDRPNVDQCRIWDSLTIFLTRVTRPHSLLSDILLRCLGPVNELLRACISEHLNFHRWSNATGHCTSKNSGSSNQPMLLIGAWTLLLYTAKMCKASSNDARHFGVEWHWAPQHSPTVHGLGPLRLGLDDSAQDMVIIQAWSTGWMVCGLQNSKANGSCNAAGKKHVAWLQCVFYVSFEYGSTLYVWPHKAKDISSHVILGIHTVTQATRTRFPLDVAAAFTGRPCFVSTRK